VKVDRRDFFKITAATGASATLASCGNPENQLIRLIPEEPFFPGVAVWKPSVCTLCAGGCGVQVRVIDGDAEVIRNGQRGILRMALPRKLEGNASHPVNQGKLCARGQAAIQATYHPDRLRQPLKRVGGRNDAPAFRPVSWDEAMAEFTGRLRQLADSNKRKGLAFLSRPMRGQRAVLVSRFLNNFGGLPPMTYETFDDRVLREANRRSFGRYQLPTFDLARTRYLISFGADFLGTWNSPVAQSVAYGEMRQGRPGTRAKFVQVESRMSQTGANADEWVPAKPGSEGVLALGLAHVILRDKLRQARDAGAAGRAIEGWDRGLPAYTPGDVSRQTGLPVDRIERLAREFAGNSPAVAMIGSAALAHTNGTFQALAVNALNALGGSLGAEGGLSFTSLFDSPAVSAGAPLEKVAQEIVDGSSSPIDTLMLYDANPVFGAPRAWRVREALAKVPYIVSFSSFHDETSILADLVLPDHSFLESWVDDAPESGSAVPVVSLGEPAMRPLHQTRAMPDVLIAASQALGPAAGPALPWKDYEEMLHTATLSLPGASQLSWDELKQRGGWWPDGTGAPTVASQTSLLAGPAKPSTPIAASEPGFDGDPAAFPFHFLPYASQSFLDGSLAHLPWLQEMPDPLSTAMWSSWVEINPTTAARLGITDKDLVEISSNHGSVRAPALLSPGIAPDIVAMPVGQGHETFTRYASDRGANPLSVLAPIADSETGSLAWAATRVRIAKVDGDGELILFAGALREQHAERH
jgi:anaerobic selenocysteine-containing dehydrogenase